MYLLAPVGKHFQKALIWDQADLCSFIRLEAVSIAVKLVQKLACKIEKKTFFQIRFFSFNKVIQQYFYFCKPHFVFFS